MSQNPDTKSPALVCLAEIATTHGVRGMVKLKSYTEDPRVLTDLGPLMDQKGERTFTLLRIQPHKNIYLAEIEGLSNKEDAAALRGTKLYIARDKLPEIAEDDAFYHIDLIGMTAQSENGNPAGKVVAVQNFGAGDLLEIKPEKGGSFFLPFTKENVPDISAEEKTLTISIPPGLID